MSLYSLLKPFPASLTAGSLTGDPDDEYYSEDEMRAHATHVIELLLPPAATSTARDDYPKGLLAVLEHDELLVSFVVFRWCSGHARDQAGNVVAPPLYEVLFRGKGPSGNLRELRHTDWGEDGYIFYAPGPLIAEAFRHLARWFDGCA